MTVAWIFALAGIGKAFSAAFMTQFFTESGYSVTFLHFITFSLTISGGDRVVRNTCMFGYRNCGQCHASSWEVETLSLTIRGHNSGMRGKGEKSKRFLVCFVFAYEDKTPPHESLGEPKLMELVSALMTGLQSRPCQLVKQVIHLFRLSDHSFINPPVQQGE